MQEYIEIGSGDPIEEDNLVEFNLLYSGQLHVASRPREKHAIRKVFHSQLRQLWVTHPNLSEIAVFRGVPSENPEGLSREDFARRGLKQIAANWNRCGFNFLPLVTEQLCLHCALDILFLRREEKNYILQSGDIDGRLKTLFDALRIVDKKDELPPRAAPEQDEDPFFCLLQDDKLISEVHVKTGPLLMLPDTKIADKHDVYLQIGVRLNPTQRVHEAWAFE